MNKKAKIFSGNLESVPNKLIYLNINNLIEGSDTLNIIQNNKIVKKGTFKKK